VVKVGEMQYWRDGIFSIFVFPASVKRLSLFQVHSTQCCPVSILFVIGLRRSRPLVPHGANFYSSRATFLT